MGSAYKNKGVQRLLDGVVDYLPAPHEVKNMALDVSDEEEEKPIELVSEDPSLPLVAIAFKLEEGRWVELLVKRSDGNSSLTHSFFFCCCSLGLVSSLTCAFTKAS